MESFKDKLRKSGRLKRLEELSNNTTTNSKQIKNIEIPMSQKVRIKYEQIQRDTKRTVENFGLGVTSSLKNTMGYLESMTFNKFDSYKQQNQVQARLKQQEEMRNPKATNSQQPLDINYRDNAKVGEAKLIEKQDDRSLIGKQIDKEVSKDEQKIQENIENAETKVGKKLAELAPSMAQSTTGMVAGAVNPYLGMAYFQTSAGGSYEREARAKGMTGEQALTYGTIMGALESATEYVGNKLTVGVGKKFFGDSIQEGLKAYGLDIAENFLEEAVMEPISEYVTQLTGGQANWDNMGQRMLESGFNGALSSVIMGGFSAGVGSAVKLVDKIQNGERITQEEISQTLKDINKSEEVDIEKLFEELKQRGINATLSTYRYVKEARKRMSLYYKGIYDYVSPIPEPLTDVTFDSYIQNSINTELNGHLKVTTTFGEYLRKNKVKEGQRSLK